VSAPLTIPDDAAETVVEPRRGWELLQLRELWEFRELFGYLIWRDVKVRYKQSSLGAGWAVLQPAATMIIFSVVFGRYARVPSNGIPYPVFSYAALLPWTFFSSGVSRSVGSLVSNQGLLTKVYFPRLIVPVAVIGSFLVDLAIAFLLFVALAGYYHVGPTPRLLALPGLTILVVLVTTSISLGLAAANVRYRDVSYVLPFLLQSWLFLTPITYARSIFPGWLQSLINLNPMTGVVEGFRWCLLARTSFPGAPIGVSALVSTLFLAGGLWYFLRQERTFADEI
jgi:lipopolysaccharide transport system permease protein